MATPTDETANFDVFIHGIKTVATPTDDVPPSEIRLVSEPVSTGDYVVLTFRATDTGQELVLKLKPESSTLDSINRMIAGAGGVEKLTWTVNLGIRK